MGNHPDQNDTAKKLEMVKNGESLIDASEWQQFLKKAESILDKVIENEKA